MKPQRFACWKQFVYSITQVLAKLVHIANRNFHVHILQDVVYYGSTSWADAVGISSIMKEI